MEKNQQFDHKVLQNPKDSLAMRRIKNIHFVGIGGAGMGGIAEVLITQGYHISGSDKVANNMTRRLERLGAKVFVGHSEKNVETADVVVSSSAIASDNPEVVSAHERRIPVVPRAQMLAELMRFRMGIAVAGTHGKTTTTSLLASVMAKGGLDPTYVIGGLLNSSGSNAKLGVSSYLVAEADESDASFMLLSPMVAIITNIDKDHLATYDHDFEKLKQTFIDFCHKLPFYGLVVACMDCPVVREILEQINRPVLTYGFHPQADYRIDQVQHQGTRTQFVLNHSGFDQPEALTLNLPGDHNVLNATAATIVALEEGVVLDSARQALSEFTGIGRRFHVFNPEFKTDDTIFVDDYGHHPAEIKATIQAVKSAWPDRKLVLAFQPHRYTRTRDLFEDFVEVLSEADQVFLLDIFAAGEKPIVGADSRALCQALRDRGTCMPVFVSEASTLPELLERHLSGHDVLVTQGAGSIGKVAQDIAQHFGLPNLAHTA